MFLGSLKELPDHVKLVVAGEDLVTLLFARLRVFKLDDLGVVFNNVGKTAWRQYLFPKIVGL